MATPATTATAGRRRTAAPRAAPELAAYKTRFNEYLVVLGLPLVDDLTPEDVASPGDIESIMCSWADNMSTHPPRYLNNPDKLLKADRSPVRNVRQRADDNPGIVRTAISAIASSPAAIAQRIVGRSAPPPPAAPRFHPPAIMSQSSTGRAGGSKTYKRWPNMSEIVIELARGGQLKSGTAYENIPPPLAILPRQLDRNERTKYNYAMRVVSAAVKEDQEAVFRAKDIDNAALVAKGKALDLEVRRWIASKTGKDLKKVKAKVLGVGANAQGLPESAWPRPTGGLFGGLLFGRNN